MRYRKVGKLCIQCGYERPLARYSHDLKRCDYCITGAFRDTVAMRAARRYARTKALRAMPYVVECAKCHKDRPPNYYPWIEDTARKGPVCNSCLRRRVGRAGGRVPDRPPESPAQAAQRALVTRILEREQARADEQARIRAQGRRCNDCWHHKSAEAFRVDTRRREGLSASCIECESLFRRLSPLGQWVQVRTALRALPTASK